MKRFYKDVAVNAAGQILLDGKPIKTPEGVVITAPNAAIAEAMQHEWQSQREKVDWNALPITRLIGGGQTISEPEATQLRADLAAYVDTDLLCYQSDQVALQTLQQYQWQPVLAWVRQRFDVSLATTQSIVPLVQPVAAHQAAQQYLASLSPFALVVMGRLVPLLGSVWLAVALRERAFEVTAAIAAAQLDETYQASHWGEDEIAAEVRAAKAEEIQLLAAMFLMLGEAGAVC